MCLIETIIEGSRWQVNMCHNKLKIRLWFHSWRQCNSHHIDMKEYNIVHLPKKKTKKHSVLEKNQEFILDFLHKAALNNKWPPTAALYISVPVLPFVAQKITILLKCFSDCEAFLCQTARVGVVSLKKANNKKVHISETDIKRKNWGVLVIHMTDQGWFQNRLLTQETKIKQKKGK